jgi:hypothetical protein
MKNNDELWYEALALLENSCYNLTSANEEIRKEVILQKKPYETLYVASIGKNLRESKRAIEEQYIPKNL